MLLHSKRGDVDGALLDNQTILRLPPPEAERLAAMLVTGQSITASGPLEQTPLGHVLEVQSIGQSAEAMTQVDRATSKKSKH